jgi:hypothetical protein
MVVEYRMLRRIFRPIRRLEKIAHGRFSWFLLLAQYEDEMGDTSKTHVKQKGAYEVKIRGAEGKTTSKTWAWM